MKRTENAKPGLLLALTPIVLTLLILGMQIFYFGVFEPHIPLAIGLAITSIVGIKLGLKWKDIERGIFHVIHVALPSVSVLITVGMIIGVWIASGTVPSIIFFIDNVFSYLENSTLHLFGRNSSSYKDIAKESVMPAIKSHTIWL